MILSQAKETEAIVHSLVTAVFVAFIFVHDLIAAPGPCPDETCHPKVKPTPLRPCLSHLTVTSPSNFYIYP
jgi:hypothetical protein